MIETEVLLGELERGHENLSSNVKKNKERVQALLERLKNAFRTIVETHGDIHDAAELDALCADLQQAQRKIDVEEPLGMLAHHILHLRKEIRSRLRQSEKWEEQPLFEKMQPTESGLDAINRARNAMGMSEVVRVNDGEYFSQEELESMRALFKELGEVAYAEYVCATRSDKFNFNNRTIQSLRPYLGDIETYGGDPLIDVPVHLLTLPSLADLRQLLFNRQRDRYTPDYQEGIEVVERHLQAQRMKATEEPRRAFIDELLEYFRKCEQVNCHERLRDNLGEGTIFPAQHQRIAVMEIERLKQVLIADGTGGGKTGSAIAGFESLRSQGKAHRALINCPSEVIGVWERALSDGPQGLFEPGKAPSVMVIRAGDNDRVHSWEEARKSDYVIISYPMLRRSTDGIPHEDLAKQLGADYHIIDESHNVRSPQTHKKRKGKPEKGGKGKMTPTDTERIFRINQCDSIRNGYTISMTATPIFNTLIDLAAQFRLLNAGQERMGGPDAPQNIDFSNLQSLAHSIAHNHTRLVRNLLLLRMLYRTTEQCLPVGTRLEIEDPEITALHPMTRACYDAIVEDPFYTASEKLEILRSLCLRLSRAGTMTGSGEDKYRSLLGKVRQYFAEPDLQPPSSHRKILILGSGPAKGVTRDYTNSKDPTGGDTQSYLAGKLREELAREGVTVFILDGDDTDSKPLRGPDGEILYDIDGAPMTKTRRIIAACRDYPGKSILFTRTDVSGQGIDLSFMQRFINLHPYFTRSEGEQGIGRIFRKGQKNDVKGCTLMTEESIETGMDELAEYKGGISEDAMGGRPLTSFEEKMVNENARKVQEGGLLAYKMYTPAQKVMWILNQIKQRGKEAAREFFRLDNGRFAKDLAENYAYQEELTTHGNCARFLSVLSEQYLPEVRKLTRRGHVHVADIGCGTLMMARMLDGQKDLTVWSSDIEPAMLDVGKRLLGKSLPPEQCTACAMDELPYLPASKHMAFVSLALHYTRHSLRRADRQKLDVSYLQQVGSERIRTLASLNRILVLGGLAFITLPKSSFRDPAKFEEFCRVLEEYFGFQVVKESTGFAEATDRKAEATFAVNILTLRKVGHPKENELTKANDWMALAFSHKISRAKKGHERTPRFISEKQKETHGAFHENFTVNGNTLSFSATEKEAKQRELHEAGRAQHQRIEAIVSSLIEQYGSIDRIPTEKLLSISLMELDRAKQEEKDLYFSELLKRYSGKLEEIPIDEISQQSPVVLVRGKTKRRGAFLCFALLDEKTRGPRPRGKRYFYESELLAQ